MTCPVGVWDAPNRKKCESAASSSTLRGNLEDGGVLLVHLNVSYTAHETLRIGIPTRIKSVRCCCCWQNGDRLPATIRALRPPGSPQFFSLKCYWYDVRRSDNLVARRFPGNCLLPRPHAVPITWLASKGASSDLIGFFSFLGDGSILQQ